MGVGGCVQSCMFVCLFLGLFFVYLHVLRNFRLGEASWHASRVLFCTARRKSPASRAALSGDDPCTNLSEGLGDVAGHCRRSGRRNYRVDSLLVGELVKRSALIGHVLQIHCDFPGRAKL